MVGIGMRGVLIGSSIEQSHTRVLILFYLFLG